MVLMPRLTNLSFYVKIYTYRTTSLRPFKKGDDHMPDFETRVHFFETDPLSKFFNGRSFAYIDVIDEMGLLHPGILDKTGAKLKLKKVLTNPDYVLGGFKIAIVFARARCSTTEIRKGVESIATDLSASDDELYDLYKRAHAEGVLDGLWN